MIAEIGGLEGLKKEAHLTFVRHLARRLTHALDRMAGPRSLTTAELEIQEVCRDRFTLYDPTCDRQVRFVNELSELSSSQPGSASAEGQSQPERANEDHLLAALLSDEPSGAGSPRLPERRPPRPDQHSVRRPAPRGRRKEDWKDYLGKWRGGVA